MVVGLKETNVLAIISDIYGTIAPSGVLDLKNTNFVVVVPSIYEMLAPSNIAAQGRSVS